MMKTFNVCPDCYSTNIVKNGSIGDGKRKYVRVELEGVCRYSIKAYSEKQILNRVKRASRQGNKLTINLKNGKSIVLLDDLRDNDHYIRYTYDGYFLGKKYHQISFTGWEGMGGYLSIDSLSGTRYYLENTPILSPNKT